MPDETLPLTGAAALRLLRAVVAADPDRLYEPDLHCLYVAPDDTGDCGVGRVLIGAGVPAAEIRTFESITPRRFPATWLELTAAEVLTAFQMHQDNLEAWRVALIAAEDTARRYGVIPEETIDA